MILPNTIMKLLITGATGRIGKTIVKNLAKSHSIWVISRKEYRPGDGVIKYIRSDILEPIDLFTKTAKVKFDAVVHLAAYHPLDPFFEPRMSMDTNVLGTQGLLEFSKMKKVQKVVFFSTFSVYGKGSSKIIDEEFTPSPANPYAMSKYFAEQLMGSFCKETGASVIILRIAGVFGGDRQEGAIYNFIKNSISNSDITVATPFNHTDMVYVKDLSKVIDGCLRHDIFGIFNVSSGEKYTAFELANLIVKITNSKSKIIVKPQDIHDVLQLHMNIDKARNFLGFKPTKIADAVLDMVGDFS